VTQTKQPPINPERFTLHPAPSAQRRQASQGIGIKKSLTLDP